MPVFVVDGKFYRVPFTSVFNTNKFIREQLPAYGAEKRTKKTWKPTVTSPPPSTVTQTSGTGSPPVNHKKFEESYNKVGTSVSEWSAEEDRLLRELRAYRLPWNRISAAMDRPVEDVKEHWKDILFGKSKNSRVSESTRDVESHRPFGEVEETKVEEKPKRRVAFSNPLVTAGDIEDDDEDDGPQLPKIKKVYYIDDEFTLEDVVLLHNIAARWERDRWLAISTRFNDKTGRSMTPEQARSLIDN